MVTAQVIIAELGLDMGQFPTAAHASAWAKLSPQTIQSGARTRPGKTGKGNRWLRGALGDAAMAAGKTDTYLGERYRRIRRRRGKQKAIVATARAILEIAYLLISNRDIRYHDLGPGYYDRERRGGGGGGRGGEGEEGGGGGGGGRGGEGGEGGGGGEGGEGRGGGGRGRSPAGSTPSARPATRSASSNASTPA